MPSDVSQPTIPQVHDEVREVSRAAWHALGMAALMAPTGSRLAALPPPKKPRNPKKAAQQAQRKARKISRGK